MKMSLGYTYYKKECTKCKRRILVEIGLIGTNHNAGVSVTCVDCIKEEQIHGNFKKRKPRSIQRHNEMDKGKKVRLVKKSMYRWIEKFWGKRCKEYQKRCGTCEAWKAYDFLFQLDFRK